MPSLSLDAMPFLSMNMAAEHFESLYDGFLGLAPYNLEQDSVKFKIHNFMWNLKNTQKVIDHSVASVFITSQLDPKGNTTSHIKFGGYDPLAIKDGESLQLMKTRNTRTWAVELVDTIMFDQTFEFESNPTYFIYEPQLPYIYLPEDDFLTFQGHASTFFSANEIHCNNR